MRDLAPIILFVYNRPIHTEQTLNALSNNLLADQSTLYIYADGPKPGADADMLQKIEKTRTVIRQKQWCKEIIIIEAEINKGLAPAVIKGVTEVVDKHGSVIVLEDDIITSKYFLQFMNEALAMYQSDSKAFSIGALNFFATDSTVPDTFFAPVPDCWGWATWKDRWALFEPNPQKLLNKLRDNNLIDKFNLYGAYNFESMLIDQIKGNVSSWAIRWQAVAYLENKLTLYPRYSVTKNIGFGHGATHGGDDRYSKNIKFANKSINVQKNQVAEDPAIIEKMIAGYRRTTQPTPLKKAKAVASKGLRYLMPSLLSKVYRKVKKYYKNEILWKGDYTSWIDALQNCTGYDTPLILEKTKAAILKVKNGEAAFERDTVLFDKHLYSWTLLSFLLKIAAENKGELNILDFGGSLGSTYFQNRPMLKSLPNLKWSIVEQEHYVNVGNELIADENLKFFFDINECFKDRNPNILLLSNVLQYLENPYNLIEQVLSYKFNYIILNRTAFNDGPKDRLTIQTVPASIYNATYPSWFFNSKNIMALLLNKYEIVYQFDSEIDGHIQLDQTTKGYWSGYILKQITS
jgi:putative methyltransferase (TIGR04325 family)